MYHQVALGRILGKFQVCQFSLSASVAITTKSCAARAGPGPLDPPSLAWTYHSDVSGAQDVYSGLVGALIIYRPGELARHTLFVPAPKGSNLTEEVLTQFLIVDENLSFYIDGNTLNRTNIPVGQLQVNRLDPGFIESNIKHGINGRLFSNLQGLNLTVGRDARWHVVSLHQIYYDDKC
jgi:hypothetical protein